MKRRCARRGKFFRRQNFLQNCAQKKRQRKFRRYTASNRYIVHDVVAGGLDFFHDSRAGQFVLACDFVEFNADVFFICPFQRYFECSFQSFSLWLVFFHSFFVICVWHTCVVMYNADISPLCRTSTCKYNRIGCPWRGPKHEIPEHEVHCVHPNRTGADVMEALRDIDARTLEERRLYDNIFDLLSYEKITFTGLYQSISFYIMRVLADIKRLCIYVPLGENMSRFFFSGNGNLRSV